MPIGPAGRSQHHLSAVGSFLPGREPRAESMVRLGCRVIRIPMVAKPLVISLLPRKARVHVDWPAAKRKALLWAGKAPTCGWLAGPMQDPHTFTAH